jgi:hypothetical protein
VPLVESSLPWKPPPLLLALQNAPCPLSILQAARPDRKPDNLYKDISSAFQATPLE